MNPMHSVKIYCNKFNFRPHEYVTIYKIGDDTFDYLFFLKNSLILNMSNFFDHIVYNTKFQIYKNYLIFFYKLFNKYGDYSPPEKKDHVMETPHHGSKSNGRKKRTTQTYNSVDALLYYGLQRRLPRRAARARSVHKPPHLRHHRRRHRCNIVDLIQLIVPCYWIFRRGGGSRVLRQDPRMTSRNPPDFFARGQQQHTHISRRDH